MSKRIWFVCGGFSLALGAVAVGGCGDDDSAPQPGGSCAVTDPSCPATDIDSECLALVDNAGEDVYALRLSQLSLLEPAALADDEVVFNIIGDGVTPNLPSCNLFGLGTFSFLAVFDEDAGTMKAGGAFPEEDPTEGFCFVHDPANDVEPVVVDSNLEADGTFSTSEIERIVVPIFDDESATSAVYLPLRGGRIVEAKLSEDRNCIGRYNADGLRPAENCAPNPGAGIGYFVNGGRLTGYVTLEDADEVEVAVVSQSLCVLLSNDADQYGDGDPDYERCKRDENGEIVFEGNWCSQTDSAGGCKDAVRLEGEVAASAVTLGDDCPGPPGTGGAGGTGGGGGSGGVGGAGGA